MTYHPHLHHRQAVRLCGYDYKHARAYFVTICIGQRECLLGTLSEGTVQLNDYGRTVAESWLWLAARHPHVALDEWVVMPNHLHDILVFTDDTDGALRKPLGRIISAFKTVSTKRINDTRSTAGAIVWQRNFYDRVIRDEGELWRAREYIASNP